MNRAGTAVVALVIGWMAGTVPVRAQEQPAPAGGADITDQAMGQYGINPVIEKLARGVENLAGGWLEVPLGIDHRYSKNDTAASMLSGLATGVIKGVVRTAVGAYEVVTFPLPYPEYYAPILPTLEYFKHDDRRRPLPLE